MSRGSQHNSIHSEKHLSLAACDSVQAVGLGIHILRQSSENLVFSV